MSFTQLDSTPRYRHHGTKESVMNQHKGSCLCGKVTFEVRGDFQSFYLCHCRFCRKDTGSAHAANLFAPSATLHWLTGEHLVKTFDYQASGHIKSFCKECGSALPNVQQDGSLVVVPAGCLDSEVPIRPNAHIFAADKANWDHDLQHIHVFDGLPE